MNGNACGRTALLAAALAGCLFGGSARAATRTWTGNWDTLPAATDDMIAVESGGNLTWSNTFPHTVASWTQAATYSGTATFTTVYGTTGFTNFTVTGNVALLGGAWTHGTNGTIEANRLRVRIGGNLLVTNATITANRCGYDQRQGPGKAAGGYIGGIHGGLVLNNTNNVYGSIVAPTNLGSGGGYTDASGKGSGGGAILLSVAGTTTVASASIISADGGYNAFLGGAGGSVYLTTGWLSGNGSIRADGSYGGSGGRVAILLTGLGADFTSWTGTNSAYGAAYASIAGAAGTVYRKTAAGFDTLIIDNNNLTNVNSISTVIPAGAPNLNTFSNVVISRKGALGVRHYTPVFDFTTFTNNLTIYGPTNSYVMIDGDANVTYPPDWLIDNYALCMNAITKTQVNVTIGTNGVLSHFQNSDAETYKLRLTLSGNLTVLSNGTITANALGYINHKGPGQSDDTKLGFDGAAYGGTAGAPQMTNGINPKTYGSIIAPTNLGSGGGGNKSSNGGGAILLTVEGTTTVHSAGVISADGLFQQISSGSGGSINLTTGWLTGNGTIRANGSNSGSSGNGSGGRVAIVLTGAGAGFTSWTGTNSAYGASGGAAGTVYRQASEVLLGAGTVIVDNSNTATNEHYTALPAFSNSTENISLTTWMTTNKARIRLVTNTAIASLVLNTNGILELAGYTLNVKTMTVTNRVCKKGVYTSADISLLTDSVGGGKVVVFGNRRTLMIKIR